MTGSLARRARHERVLLLLPVVLLLALVVGVPALRVVLLGFTRTELADGVVSSWAGLATHARTFADGRFLSALRNTAVFTSLSVSLEVTLGMALALLLDRSFRGRGALRAVVLVPWALPTSVMALAWAWIFHDTFGMANDLLSRLGLIEAPVAWLARPATAMAALVVADAWKTTPFVALILLAGLQAVPSEVLEAARVDGAGSWQRFRRITLPLLVPSLVVATLFRSIQAWGAFDIVYVMTGGGPGGSTETLSLYAFQSWFRYLDFGYGAAIAVQGMLVALLLAAVVVKLASRRETA
ncbi:MAG: sugar ABC transporter permease [Holophagales bacterium]|nr:sugar ABC transporter permease [Holophagales bacterium]